MDVLNLIVWLVVGNALYYACRTIYRSLVNWAWRYGGGGDDEI